MEKQERKFVPTKLGTAVCDFLTGYFPDVFDYSFTAQMEDELDEISRGERQWQPTVRQFYEPFAKKLEETLQVAEKVKMEVELAGKKCPECSKPVKRLVGKGAGIIFKGSGFYATDYRKGKKTDKPDIKNICPKAKEGCDGCQT